MKALTDLTITEAIKGLKEKEFSCAEIVEAHINSIEKHNKSLNAFITKTFDVARRKAQESDKSFLNGEERLLEGIPIAVKDLFCTENVKTTCASKMLENFVPTYESTVTKKLFSSGAIMLGKTNLDEFAMGSANIYSHFGKAINPWKSKQGDNLIPGGSSGGSAIAVAAKMSMGATGTDTGGSVRQPAALCGVVGFKPSYGRCSRYGIVAFASSLDQAGIFARTVDDTAILSKIIMGSDTKDSTCANLPAPDISCALQKDVKGLKIGIPGEYDSDKLDPEIKELWQNAAKALADQGAEIVPISLPNTKYGVASYYVIAPAEASSNLSRFDGVRYGLRECKEGMTLDEMYENTRSSGFGEEVERRIMIGTYVLSAEAYDVYFAHAQKTRRLIANDFKNAFEKVDALLTPVTTTAAYSNNDQKKMDPISMYFNDIFTIPASMAGLPAMSIPGKLNKQNLPIGLHVIGTRCDEEMVFCVAKNLERYFDFKSSPQGF